MNMAKSWTFYSIISKQKKSIKIERYYAYLFKFEIQKTQSSYLGVRNLNKQFWCIIFRGLFAEYETNDS
jgi:hypothetical protein